MPPSVLPVEIWIQILEHLGQTDVETLWQSAQYVTKSWKDIASSIVRDQTIPKFIIGINYTLGSGHYHRWYDIRASLTLSFTSFSASNPQYALYSKVSIHPESCHARALEKWNRILANGMGEEVEWRVQLREGDGRTSSIKLLKLPRLVAAEDGVFCDWKELCARYFGKEVDEDQKRVQQWRNS